MIAKGKAIAHGKVAIEYAMRTSKGAELISSNLVQNNTPEKIYQEFEAIQKYNSRCKNKFIRFEIGIAPQDQEKLTRDDLIHISEEFSKRLGFQNHQWIACIHRDTDNLHMHMIVNRIGIDQSVYDTSFISNRASKTAEDISLAMGLTLAKNIKTKYKSRYEIETPERVFARIKIQKSALEVLRTQPTNLKVFQEAMKQKGIIVEEAKNKKGNTFGLRFTSSDETFKASAIGKEFGYRTLLNTFQENKDLSIDQTNSYQVEDNSRKDLGLNRILGAFSSDSTEIDESDDPNKKRKRKRYGR